jgi:RNA polymerase sigma-70 factor (ECF subfamily)
MHEADYERLIEPHRAELRAHCYRMLGSAHDAEDALQEAMLRAWRGLEKFEGRSSPRSWLYTIATNVCLKMIGRRPKLVLPVDYGPPSDPHDGPGRPVVESVWVEPFPDERLGLDDALAGPEARYDQRESIELAFIAALQHLPARQRAVLILRDVLGFSAREVAATLDATPASIDAALQRARKNVDERLPKQSQQATLRALGDRRLREIVDKFVAAWERHANGQPAFANYFWDADREAFVANDIVVLSMDGARIAEITAFLTREVVERFGLPAEIA